MSSDVASKPKPTMTGAALHRRGGTQAQNADHPPKGQLTHRRRTLAPPPAAGSHGAGMVSDTASSISTSTHTRPQQYTAPVKLENTFRMQPYTDGKFVCKRVHDAVSGIMESYLIDVEYDKERCPTLTRDLSQMIKQRVREMDFERYKIVVTVVMGENTGQGCAHVSRFLWNTTTDNFTTVTHTNKTLYAVATVYGVYQE